MGETYYCDDYEAVTGLEREPQEVGVISTKVLTPPDAAEVEASPAKVETK